MRAAALICLLLLLLSACDDFASTAETAYVTLQYRDPQDLRERWLEQHAPGLISRGCPRPPLTLAKEVGLAKSEAVRLELAAELIRTGHYQASEGAHDGNVEPITDWLEQACEVEVDVEHRQLRVGFRDPDPERAVAISTLFAGQVVASYARMDKKRALAAIDALEFQAEQQSRFLKLAELEYKVFLDKHGDAEQLENAGKALQDALVAAEKSEEVQAIEKAKATLVQHERLNRSLLSITRRVEQYSTDFEALKRLVAEEKQLVHSGWSPLAISKPASPQN